MIKKSVLAAALLSAICTQAQAITINTDGQWHEFDVDNSVSNSGGLEWIDLNNDALSFDFTLAGSAILKVVDAGYAGDRFNIYDNGVLLGATSAAVNTYPNQPEHNFDLAYADSNFSRGIFWLGAGNHNITGLLGQSALFDVNDPDSEINATFGAVSLTAVPLPAAAWFYLSGAGLLGWTSRRQSNV